MSERRATTLIGADRATIRYRSRRPDDTALRARLRDLAHQRHRFGYRRLFVLLWREGDAASRNKAYRLACCSIHAKRRINWAGSRAYSRKVDRLF